MAPTKYDKEPQRGDLIEISRVGYQHWAVYVGEGFIVHLTSQDMGAGKVAGVSCSVSVVADKAVVKKEKLSSVVGNCDWKINNSLDKEYEPRPADVIVKEACAMVGDELPYSVLSQNCEHWASKLRYGKAESRQVKKVTQAVQEVTWYGAVVAAVGAVAAAAMALLRR